jgi:hypothetical protein
MVFSKLTLSLIPAWKPVGFGCAWGQASGLWDGSRRDMENDYRFLRYWGQEPGQGRMLQKDVSSAQTWFPLVDVMYTFLLPMLKKSQKCVSGFLTLTSLVTGTRPTLLGQKLQMTTASNNECLSGWGGGGRFRKRAEDKTHLEIWAPSWITLERTNAEKHNISLPPSLNLGVCHSFSEAWIRACLRKVLAYLLIYLLANLLFIMVLGNWT